MRSDVSFTSSGTVCRGWFYLPDMRGDAPGIVMSHGFSATRGMGLEAFAERFCAAGFAVLLFDYRHLGASDGNERGRIIPQEQHDDLRSAIGWLSQQRGVDTARIGLWGSSYSGGHCFFVGALDPRVKAIAVQAPAVEVARSLIHLAGREGFNGYLGLLAEDHAARNRGEPGARIPVVAQEGVSVFPTPDSYEWFTKAGGPGWMNSTTFESVARMAEYTPAALIDLISPRPLLVIAGETDSLIPLAQVRAAFARAGEPKRLDVHPCGHFDFYPGQPFHEQAAKAATDWFVKHLGK